MKATGPKVTIDWKAYFRAFDEQHGFNPVQHRNRWLWQDGWQYALLDHKGPEYRPPDDLKELQKLQVVYWTLRKRIVLREVHRLTVMVGSLKELQESRSAPLQEKVKLPGDDNKPYATVRTLDLSAHEIRLADLKEDVELCDQKLRELNVD